MSDRFVDSGFYTVPPDEAKLLREQARRQPMSDEHSHFIADEPLGLRPTSATTAEGLLDHLHAARSPVEVQRRLVALYIEEHAIGDELRASLVDSGLL